MFRSPGWIPIIVLRLIAACLFVEGTLTVLWLTSLLSTLSVYDARTLVVIGARGFVGTLQLTSAWMLLGGRLPARTFAVAAFALSAILIVAELGARLSPSNLDPTFRWPIVALYSVYATTMIWLLTRGRGAK